GGKSLAGWNALFYKELGPPSASWNAVPEALPIAQLEGRRPDWSSLDGVIVGRKSGTGWPLEFAQSCLVSRAALHDVESLRYEFFYEAGRVEVHPALGRLAFVLEPNGVRLHWMTPNNFDQDWSGAAVENLTEDPEHRRGPARLPFKAKDWNTVQLTIVGGI